MTLPLIALFTVGMAWLVLLGLTEVRAIDGAREAARAAARGESDATAGSLGRRVAGSGSRVSLQREGPTITAVVRSPVRGPRGVFAGLPSPVEVTRYHSLAVDPASLPAALSVTATAPDGTIMGLIHETAPVEGVQFHPESIASQHGAAMIATFLARCGIAARQAA